MMYRRITALLLTLALLFCLTAVAEEKEPDLAPMFALMETEAKDETKMRSVASSVMPNSRAVLGTSLSYEEKSYTTDEIISAMTTAAIELGSLVISQDAGLLNPEVIELYGLPAVHTKVSFCLDTEEGELPLCGEVYVLSIQNCLLECWILSPDVSLYEGNETALAQRNEDVETARKAILEDEGMKAAAEGHTLLTTGQLILSPSTASTEVEPMESVPYASSEGTFTLNVPKDAVVLTPQSTDDEIAAVREGYLSAMPEGGERAFDLLEDDIRKEGGTLIFTADFQGLVEIFREEHPEYKNVMNLKYLAMGCEDVSDNLTQEYGQSELMTSYEMEMISDLMHTRAVFQLKCGEIPLKMAMMDTFTEDYVLWEADIFATEEKLFDSLYRLTVDSLRYLSPKNNKMDE